MASNYWIKLYHEILDDPKMCRLTDRQYRRVIELFLLAGDYEKDGHLPQYDDIDFRLRFPEGLKEDLESLIKFEILSLDETDDYYITRWADRQSAMTNTERSQRRRERERKQSYYNNDDVTPMQRKCTDSVAEEDKERDKDKDVDTKTTSSFIPEFLTAVRVQFTNSNQASKVDDLVEDYGENIVLECATWYGQNNPRNMSHALKSIDTALMRGWDQGSKKIKKKSAGVEFNPKELK